MRGTGVWEGQTDFANMVDMLFGCLAEDHDVVWVNKCELPFDFLTELRLEYIGLCQEHSVSQNAYRIGGINRGAI